MNYSRIIKYDATNWEGINTTIFFSGCTFACKGCFNSSIWDFNSGEEFTKDIMDEFIEHAKSPRISGICILGGEPLQQDLDILLIFVERLVFEVGKPIHLWSGYLYEDILLDEKKRKIIELVDTLVDGKFDINLKDLTLRYRGSSNQRVIDVQKSLNKKEIILIEE